MNNRPSNPSVHVNWRDLLEALYGMAVLAAHPKSCLVDRLPNPSAYKSVKIIALGKAAARSAEIVEKHWSNVQISGIAVTPHQGDITCSKIDILETSHPYPNHASVEAGHRVLHIAQSAGKEDLVLLLLSGGASSSVALPVNGLDIREKQKVTKDLMLKGATINELNIVRKHLSLIKGGQLAVAAANAKQIITLAISDVIDDDPSVIGSGPTVSDPSSIDDAKAIIQKYGAQYSGHFSETISNDHAVFSKCRYEVLANARSAIDSAADFARQLGLNPQILNYNTIGDAEINGKAQARFITRMYTRRGKQPKLLMFGGEYTAKVTDKGLIGEGKGGPNQHFLLSLFNELPDDIGIYALSADTDGQDGSGGAAGAWFTPSCKTRVRELGLNPKYYLANSNSFGFFQKLGNYIQARPTHTNVNDFRAILIPALEE